MISGSVVGMSLLGYFLDKKFGWEPWGLLTCALLGVAVGMYELWKLMFSGKSS
ncbi:MAG: AtpZ/AtpI family protein [Lentisphaeria bacterium]|nr:AtpZ/AtpI family protein [Candidatus Neomarinimicrobiota bacterium]MCF7842439.1 AtpZ/AtpI family protein [Lentisphaeria bacterium]